VPEDAKGLVSGALKAVRDVGLCTCLARFAGSGGDEASAERAVGDEADAELFADVEDRPCCRQTAVDYLMLPSSQTA
jgi:hypothetical protein